VRTAASFACSRESNTLDRMSTHESWPGENGTDEREPDEPDAPEEDDASDEEPEDDDEPADHDDQPDEHDDDEDTGGDEPQLRIAAHEDGELEIPEGVDVLEGEPRSTRRGVGIVVSRASSAVANRLLESALAELDRAGVSRDHVLVMAVPGAFELPIGAMALAKTRRYACIVALGSATDSAVVAGEAASGLQLAGLETGVPIAFGLLTDGDEAVESRGAEAVRNALEMADLFQQLRATAQAAK
jgi:6,7-dimethyl-8-ribityllumazine synthase